jgi:hypothetical protein
VRRALRFFERFFHFLLEYSSRAPYRYGMQAHQFPTATEAKAFALAGNAILTLQSLKTGVHYTYKVTASKPEEGKQGVHFVKLLTSGSADEGEFTYLGIIRANRFMLTKASKANEDSGCFKAFDFFWNRTNGVMPPQLVVRHEGRCGRCGRTLTVPESIDLGIGPECAAKMGGAL